MSHTVKHCTLSLTRTSTFIFSLVLSLPPLVLWCQQSKLIVKKSENLPFAVRLCCNLWSLHRDLTIVSPLAAFCPFFAADRADRSRPASTEPAATSTVSTESALLLFSSCPGSSWVISRTLELLPSINGTATGGMLSLGELSVVRRKSLSIKKAGKGIVVFYPGDFCEALLSRMHQPGSCFLWAFKGGARSRRIRAWGDCHNTDCPPNNQTQPVPQTIKPSKH